jgi:hypothetical protein
VSNKDEDLYDLIDYCIIGEYLFVKKERQIEYMRVINNPKYSIEESITLNLKLDEGIEILRILGT